MSQKIQNLGEVYALLVCLVAMLTLMVSSGRSLDHLVTFAFTEIHKPRISLNYSNNENYLLHIQERRCRGANISEFDVPFCKELNNPDLKRLEANEPELTKRRLTEYSYRIAEIKTEALDGLFDHLIIIFVSMVGFYFHGVCASAFR